MNVPSSVIGVGLFNNLLAPLIAELFVSPDCFRYVVQEAPDLSFSYNDFTCEYVNEVVRDRVFTEFICSVSSQETSSSSQLIVPAPFHYSYQCSFALLSNYTYVFIFRFVLSIFIEPLIIMLLKLLQKQSSTLSSLLHPIIIGLLPPLWKLHIEDGQGHDMANNIQNLNHTLTGLKRLRRKFLASFVIYFSMVICFGALFPPLALVIAVSIVKDCWEVRLALGRIEQYIEYYNNVNMNMVKNLIQIRYQIHQSLSDGVVLLMEHIWASVYVSVWIWAFVLFDILSPVAGIENSVGILVMMIVSPYILKYSHSVLLLLVTSDNRVNSNSNSNVLNVVISSSSIDNTNNNNNSVSSDNGPVSTVNPVYEMSLRPSEIQRYNNEIRDTEEDGDVDYVIQ